MAKTESSQVPGYEDLSEVLGKAYNQAARGKGKRRHARNKPFSKQPILEIGRMVGVGSPAGQVMKKTQEAVAMANRGEFDAARAELLGAINYAAAVHILIDEMELEALANQTHDPVRLDQEIRQTITDSEDAG